MRTCLARLGTGCLLIVLMAPNPASALEIILDTGRTRPLVIPDARPPGPSPQPQPHDLALLFPVRSPSLTVGSPAPLSEASRKRLRGLERPLFLVGADAASLDWLAAHRGTLHRLGAIGFVVEAATLAEFQALVAAAGPDLPLVPSSGEALAEVLGLSHYPVLITREGLHR